MSLVRPGVTCFFGQPYTGKSTLMLRRLELERRPRVLIFDPAGSSALDRYPALSTLAGARQFFARHSAGRWVRTVRSADLSLYVALAQTVKHWRAVVWVLDDAQSLLADPRIEAAAELVATAGRHMGNRAGVELWCIAQRPFFLTPTMRAMCMRIFTFHQAEPTDLRYLQERGGEAFAQAVRGLAGHEFTSWPFEGEGVTWSATGTPLTSRARTTTRAGMERPPRLRLA